MRVAVCSPNRILREALAKLLAGEPALRPETGASVRELTHSVQPGERLVMVVDSDTLSLVDTNYLLGAATFGHVAPILFGDPSREFPGFKQRVSSEAPIEELIQRVKDAAGPPPPVFKKRPRLSANPYGLTNREYEIAQLVARGMSNRKIAETLALKEQSVNTLVCRVLSKLRLESRVQLAVELVRRSTLEKKEEPNPN